MSVVCTYYSSGNCPNGDFCRLLHPSPYDAKRDIRPCQQYLQGTCHFGDRCHFSHRQNDGRSEKVFEASQYSDDAEVIYTIDKGIQTDDKWRDPSRTRKIILEKGKAIYDRMIKDPLIYQTIRENEPDLLHDMSKLFNPENV